MSEYCSLNGIDLLKEVPSLLCSCVGSSLASTAVLSQIELKPGAVTAAHAVPEDCGKLPPLASFSANSCDSVCAGPGATVMSAPIRASHKGDSGCFTETAAEPFGLSFPDHDGPVAGPACGERGFDAGAPFINVEASTSSWLQSSSLGSGMAEASTSPEACRWSSTGAGCARVCGADNPQPAASISASPYRSVET